MSLTAEQILALAPDAASAKAGSGQASMSKWSGLGASDKALWGLCQGSGKDPYKAQIELAGPAFKCTCPSRKFPCKHGLGLYLLHARDASAFSDSSLPAWVSDWLGAREQRVEQKAAKAAADGAPTAEEAAAKEKSQRKRQEKREDNVAAGLAILDTWLADLARDGLAGLRSKPAQDWNATAARLVDTQAAGLAARLRRAGMLIYASSSAGWETAVARELGQIALLSQAWRRLARLPAPLQHDVRSAIGFVASTDEALAEPGHSDVWHVCGTHSADDERVSRRACYLYGQQSGRWAMLLQFAAGAQALPPPLLPGSVYQGTLHYYPSAAPLRAAFGADMQLATTAATPQGAVIDVLLAHYSAMLAAQPFLEAQPMLLSEVTPQLADHGWLLRGADGASLALDPRFRHGFHLHALTGGAASAIFGLWDGYSLLPLAVRCADRLYSLDGIDAR
ncbi:hypothetical protein [Massilia sp. CF038]|uniref:hypothetical protein n=1 Tax=Massilia sp. CF038 TaxID=1881045 RepID=UPI00090FB015|nr:hypothetical protein [Massilia sp. CF038]SHG46734.1 hypothetical protein SAMN05428948_0612 [Massilia sp. CF038]